MNDNKIILNLDKPAWQAPQTNFLNTVFEEHKKIIELIANAELNPNATSIEYEYVCRAFISLIMTEGERKNIISYANEQYKEEFIKLKENNDGLTDGKKARIARQRAWLNALTQACTYVNKYYKSQGHEMKIAVVYEDMHDKKGNNIRITDDTDNSDIEAL